MLAARSFPTRLARREELVDEVCAELDEEE